ncbi:putative auxin response factor domain-containing protein [Helianthus debilis subsp. tardiflorus]
MALFLVYDNDLKIYTCSVVIDLIRPIQITLDFIITYLNIIIITNHLSKPKYPFHFANFFENRTSPTEFVIPLAKYYKAVYSNQISLGMWFQMMFETKEGTRMHMGTIISDLNGVRRKNSQWRNLQVYLLLMLAYFRTTKVLPT